MTTVHAVWRGLIVSISFLQVFSGPQLRDVEQPVPRHLSCERTDEGLRRMITDKIIKQLTNYEKTKFSN